MATSPYLTRALQQLQQPPAAPAAIGPNPAALAAFGQRARAYKAANPGGNYLAHNIVQAGRNLENAPANAGHGLVQFVHSLPGVNPSPSPGGVKRPNGAIPPAAGIAQTVGSPAVPQGAPAAVHSGVLPTPQSPPPLVTAPQAPAPVYTGHAIPLHTPPHPITKTPQPQPPPLAPIPAQAALLPPSTAAGAPPVQPAPLGPALVPTQGPPPPQPPTAPLPVAPQPPIQLAPTPQAPMPGVQPVPAPMTVPPPVRPALYPQPGVHPLARLRAALQ